MPSAAVQLIASVFAPLLQSFRPATRKAYNKMFTDFMAFLVAAGLLPSQVDVHILLAFMEYLCQNNFTPSNISNYLAGFIWPRGDIIFSHDIAIILVKWSKTIQFRDKIAHIHIPVLPGSRLCSVAALKRMLAIVPLSHDDPLFSVCRQGRWVPITDSIVRKHLKCVSHILCWEHLHIAFHTFRRSGTFQLGVPIDAIKQQGTWNCKWKW